MRAAIIAAGLLAGCSHAPAAPVSNAAAALPRPTGASLDQPPATALVPASAYLGERNVCIDRELERLGLNQFGDPLGTVYASGSPLRNEVTGTVVNRYDYVLRARRDIGAKCMRIPSEPDR